MLYQCDVSVRFGEHKYLLISVFDSLQYLTRLLSLDFDEPVSVPLDKLRNELEIPMASAFSHDQIDLDIYQRTHDGNEVQCQEMERHGANASVLVSSVDWMALPPGEYD